MPSNEQNPPQSNTKKVSKNNVNIITKNSSQNVKDNLMISKQSANSPSRLKPVSFNNLSLDDGLGNQQGQQQASKITNNVKANTGNMDLFSNTGMNQSQSSE